MPRTIRFEWEGKNYEVGVERAGDRLTLTHEGKRYVVTLLPERNESTASLSPAATQAPSAATARGPTRPATRCPIPPCGRD